ncbi:hypothetical protein TRFO_07715 [Tritrichomonas foetus]|uniref:Uncharacterized protein n=1 Tax=Tritrichomonas foetus TaxID=1144522 RepID=A0A1J4JRH4_9EUKA|nr:hypothetical protein TRFO_07715 [Tritrichomonas foetus]|eukprot:OHT01040.1 hypothetical protein TRFO_07715 [Tritrichomonas foetus]
MDFASLLGGFQTEPEEEPEQGEGVPLPPGFDRAPINFSSKEGKEQSRKISNEIGRSLAFSPLLSSLSIIITTAIGFKPAFMQLTDLFTLISTSLMAISTSLSKNHHLLFGNRITLIGIAFALLLFVLWRARAMDLLGDQTSPVSHSQAAPFIFTTKDD